MIISHNNIIINFNNSIVDTINSVIPLVPSSIITDGLIVYLDASNSLSYSGSGNTWIDLSNNSNNGTITNATYSTNNGGYFNFDGNGDYISITNKPSLSFNTTQVKTMQIWVKINSLLSEMVIINKLTDSFVFDGYYLTVQTNGSIRAITNGTSIPKSTPSSAGLISTGNWYFITFSGVINNTPNSTKVYLGTDNIISTQHGTDGYSENNNLLLGANLRRPNVSGNDLNGNIGMFLFYNRELSISEITDNYNNTKTRFEI